MNIKTTIYPDGVSIVVCCYNSSKRIRPTLEHLANQVRSQVPWELLIIDNASTDHFDKIVYQVWPSHLREYLRIIHEPNPGVSNARLRAFKEAKYSLLSFVDDDNWVCEEWVSSVFDFMNLNQNVGALGSYNVPEFEVAPPAWFNNYLEAYGLTPAHWEFGIVPLTRSYIHGAGITIRRSAWDQIIQLGFCFTTKGRQGSVLSAGEDSEICLAIRLLNWDLVIDKRIQLRHFIPKNRLQWSYVLKLHSGFGASKPMLNMYFAKVFIHESKIMNFLRRSRISQLVYASMQIMRLLLINFIFYSASKREGFKYRVQLETYLGYFKGLLLLCPKESSNLFLSNLKRDQN